MVCGGCGGEFEPSRRDAKWCSSACRIAGHKAAKRYQGEVPPPAGKPGTDNGSVTDKPVFLQVRAPVAAAAPAARPKLKLYSCCKHCPPFRHARHLDACRQGCPS